MLATAAPAAAQERVLDDFQAVDDWKALPSAGVELRLGADSGYRGRAMRLDFDFGERSGYAIARKAIPIDLPANYAFTFQIRGDAPTNNLEFKLVDPTGDNVWWVNRRNYDWPTDWTKVTVRKRHLEFAWGPLGGGDPKRMAALEFVITAGTGGKGTVWIDELTFTPLEPVTAYNLTPAVRASSAVKGQQAARALDGDTGTVWRSAPSDRAPRLDVDFLKSREFGGLVVDWDRDDYATDYEVQTSADGKRWATAYALAGGNGARDHLPIPESESRYLRLAFTKSSRGRGVAVRELRVQPVAYAATPNAFFAAVAKDAPRGDYPKYLHDEQSYWTVVGVPGDDREGLIDEEGTVEVDVGSFSIEPFLWTSGTRKLITWADVTPRQSLEQEYLPVPSVRWDATPVALTVTAFAHGRAGESALYGRYRVENRGGERQRATLFLAVRPFQVNPSWQFLNIQGGVTKIRQVAYEGGVATINGGKRVISLTPPSGFGAATFDQGGVIASLREGRLPAATRVSDRQGYASGAFAYELDLPPGAVRDVYIAAPFHTPPRELTASMSAGADSTFGAQRLAAVVASWKSELDRVGIQLPVQADTVMRTLKSNLGYVLINRDSAAYQPGSRAYDRSWIRDGSLTSAALLRLGHADEVREFIEWYAPFQYPNGYVPCCADSRGADPVPEHDSHGQLIYLIAEYFRFTGDTTFLRKTWPNVTRAVSYIDSLRHSRMTDEYKAPDKLAFWGLVPASISHEGYSAKPMHSYWDDFFVLRGLKDATYIAGVLGERQQEAAVRASRDGFERDLQASIRRAMAMKTIDFIPGSVELGDFDATSTTVGITPGGERAKLPEAALRRTFDKYYEDFVKRRDGTMKWDGYTPYEWRVVGTFVRLGQRERAHELLDWHMGNRRPPAWNHWAEVVWRDPKTPKFLGDMPHTWVGSDFMRSVLDMLAYEREDDDALVVGAGVTRDWVTTAPGVIVKGLHTYYGPLSYTMRADGDRVRVRLEGLTRTPPGGIVLRSPLDTPVRSVTVDGRAVKLAAPGELRLHRLPATVELRH